MWVFCNHALLNGAVDLADQMDYLVITGVMLE